MKETIDKIEEIRRFRLNHLFNVGHGNLTDNEDHLDGLLIIAKSHLKDGKDIPPTLLLETFVITHWAGFPQLSFVMDWLYAGALGFHQADGKEHFERFLGFTASRGKHSGQGHEFDTARREKVIQREKLYTQIRMLNKFENITVDRAVGIIHELYSRHLGAQIRKKNRKPLSPSELHAGYRSWKGKVWDEETEKDYRKKWDELRPEWMNLITQIEGDFNSPI